MAPALFVSDLHLCPTRPQVVAQFDDFLAGTATAAGALYILGDLFEYWAGDDDLSDEFNAAIARSICAGVIPVVLAWLSTNPIALLIRNAKRPRYRPVLWS